MSKNNTNKMRDTSDKKVSFGGTSRKRFTRSGTQGIFEQIDSTLNENAMAVKD